MSRPHEDDLESFSSGMHEELWTMLGSRVVPGGVRFDVWAPHAGDVSVVGDFNDWHPDTNPLTDSGHGVWSGEVAGIGAGTLYQFEILSLSGERLLKSDPMARETQFQPQRSSVVHVSDHAWGDDEWMAARPDRQPYREPMSVYEVHLGSWRRGRSFAMLTEELVPYVRDLGFTHVELMPLMEHPYIGSWGYQVSGYFATSSRLGSPDDLRTLIDAFHQAGIAVILDWVPAHFPQDEWSLDRFDGSALYEPAELDEHPDWGTSTFDLARPQVRSFLISNAVFWLEEFHADGLRVDAVASMLYLDYSRRSGAWRPNRHGGNENLEAISFLQELNAICYRRNPGIAMIAEDSTAWDGVTRMVEHGGLGFGFKWNLGWMHDTLDYLAVDPLYRQHQHHSMTLPSTYAASENFVLPLSHDEVVHGKGSLVAKMPGAPEQQLATVRAYLAFMWAHPGKQLVFMGVELAQLREWSEKRSLDWHLLDDPGHARVHDLVGTLNRHYRDLPCLWTGDYSPGGFAWIEAEDRWHNVFSFTRTAGAQTLVCVSNFAGIDHGAYRLGMPHAGDWTILVSTGDGAPIEGTCVVAEPQAAQGRPASATIWLPALGTLWLVSAYDQQRR